MPARSTHLPGSSMRDEDLDQYLSEISQFPLLSQDEEQELARRVATGDDAARQRLISCNLRLVVSIAKYYAKRTRGLSLGDLINEGNLGLIKASERFAPNRGGKFSTYGSYWIRQAIRRALINKARTVRVPAYMVELLSRWLKAQGELVHDLGRAPTPEEVADRCGIPHAKLKDIRRALVAGAASGKGGDADQETISLEEFVVAHETGEILEDALAADLAADHIDATLDACLSDREGLIIKMRYGLGVYTEPITLANVGRAIGLTRERVRQIEQAARRKLQLFLLGNQEE